MAPALDFTTPHVLRTEAEYQEAVREMDALLDAEVAEGSPGWEHLKFLAVLVEAYEAEQLPFENDEPAGTPQSAVDFMLEQRGMSRGELAPLLGGKARVSEFFSGKRALSKSQIVALREALGIPADLLI